MSYAADFTLANTASFQQQVQMSAVKAGIAISNEARTVHPDLDAKRHSLAVTVLTNFTQPLLLQFAMAVIEAGALVSGATDSQVDAQVSAVWNGVAGVSAQDQA